MTFIKRNVMFAILYAAFCFNVNATDSGVNKATPEVPVAGQIFTQLPSTLTLKGNALPFENYQAWLAHAQSNNQKIAFVDRWQKRVNPKAFNTLIKQTSAQWIEYESDGLKISGVMVVPKSAGNEKLPVIIYNRGGNNKHNVSRITVVDRLLPLAAQGYIVLASNYRGSRFSEGEDEFGGKDVHDVLALIDIAKQLPHADSSKIALYGVSRGGMMTWKALRQLKASNDIKTAIVVAGPTDLHFVINRRADMKALLYRMIPDIENNQETALNARSAVKWVDELNTKVPLLLIHGDADVRVDVAHTNMAAKALSENQHPHKVVIYKSGDHGLTFYQKEMKAEISSWLSQHM